MNLLFKIARKVPIISIFVIIGGFFLLYPFARVYYWVTKYLGLRIIRSLHKNSSLELKNQNYDFKVMRKLNRYGWYIMPGYHYNFGFMYRDPLTTK